MQTNETIYLKDYTPPAFTVDSIDLRFDLQETHARVTNTMVLSKLSEAPLWLDGDELILESVLLNQKALSDAEYVVNEHGLRIENCPDHFELQIITKIFPQKNTALSGLYRSNGFFCTQCEAQGFRRITYYLDRPDVLSVFTTTVYADKAKYPILLSNGNLVESGDVEAGRHYAKWHDPFKKPAYLFALVSGDLAYIQDEFVTHKGKPVDLYLYVEHGQEDKAEHAMNSLKAAMRWDEKTYGLEYDLSRYMIVAVSDFNMGAMENKGLNIFNAKYILARPDTATDRDYADIEGVVAHEYFHNWTGNRVTCRDWFQLSLKEGLTVFRDQEFSRDMNSRDVNRILDVKVLRQAQFPEDAGRMAHPVRPPAYQEINNFYTATVYNKGAEVIRMLETLLTKAGFRQGMDLYFERHDGQAVTIEDFVAAMADANHKNLDQFFNWYTQSGTPHVKLMNKQFEGGTLTLTFEQTGLKHPVPIPIKTALFTEQGEQLTDDGLVLLLEETQQTFTLENLSSVPAYISLLRGFSAPVILEDGATKEELLGLLRVETDGFARAEAAMRLAKACIIKAYEQSATPVLDGVLVDAFQAILADDATDSALRALLLTPPSFEEVAIDIPHVDVTKLEAARNAYQALLGQALLKPLATCYEALLAEEDHAMHAKAYARRALKNRCLQLLAKADTNTAYPKAKTQFEQAKTMTSQLASFSVLANMPDEDVRQAAIDAFFKQWQHDELVLDKWFTVQATAEPENTLARVQALMKHPLFDIKNPNKVRALIGAFCQGNPQHFHAVDGSGYDFLVEQIQAIDALNPQVAARLTTPFTRWQKLDAPRQALMQAALKKLSAGKLSKDVREMVEKSLSA